VPPRSPSPLSFDDLADRASQLYRSAGIAAWQFARGKLRGDPLYRSVWERPELRENGTLIDLGCGQGLMLALFVAEDANGPAPPVEEGKAKRRRLIGVETRAHMASVARIALGAGADIVSADIRRIPLPPSRTILVFDVLHMMSADDQESVLGALVQSLEPEGTLLIREADASAGWRFHCVQAGNRFKALMKGYSSKDFHFRTARGWQSLVGSYGLAVKASPMGTGTPFGNILLVAKKAKAAVPSHGQAQTS